MHYNATIFEIIIQASSDSEDSKLKEAVTPRLFL